MSRIHDIQYIDRNVTKYRYIILLLHPQSLVHTKIMVKELCVVYMGTDAREINCIETLMNG